MKLNRVIKAVAIFSEVITRNLYEFKIHICFNNIKVHCNALFHTAFKMF